MVVYSASANWRANDRVGQRLRRLVCRGDLRRSAAGRRAVRVYRRNRRIARVSPPCRRTPAGHHPVQLAGPAVRQPPLPPPPAEPGEGRSAGAVRRRHGTPGVPDPRLQSPPGAAQLRHTRLFPGSSQVGRRRHGRACTRCRRRAALPGIVGPAAHRPLGAEAAQRNVGQLRALPGPDRPVRLTAGAGADGTAL